MNEINNLETMAYHYVCRHPENFKKVDRTFFKNKILGWNYWLTQEYYHSFRELPFKFTNPISDRMLTYAGSVLGEIDMDGIDAPDQKLERLRTNIDAILSFNYGTYDSAWLAKQIKAWIDYQRMQFGFQKAIKYQKVNEINAENIHDSIRTIKLILANSMSVDEGMDDGISFWNPEAHKQTEPIDLIDSGFPTLNMWLGGGFERGTTTLILGTPNVGKSIWLGNLAANIAINGVNVLFISLEMAGYKVAKRIGSNLFDVDVNDYHKFSSDEVNIGQAIKELRGRVNMEMRQAGELLIKRYSAATMTDIETYALRKEDELGLKWGAIVIDYLGELENEAGFGLDQMYSKHKLNTNRMFNVGVDNKWAMISAHQLKAEYEGADDYNLKALAESSGIQHRPDFIFGIMQSPGMKLNKLYKLKDLKDRDSGYKDWSSDFSIEYSRMRLTDMVSMVEPTQLF